jgi:hypothetical protein
MEKQVRHLSQPDLCAYKTIRDWHNRVPDLLAYIADELHPQGLEAIEKDNFHALKQMLRNQ